MASLAAEAFVVCQHFQIPAGFEPSQLRSLLQSASQSSCGEEQPSAASRLLVPFLACGDLSGERSPPGFDATHLLGQS